MRAPFKKVLTVSVAAYNVEGSIRETLDSLLVPEVLSKLEVLVVDDGSTDMTYAVAAEYERRYPQTFHVVHKENGGYGSTVNHSLAHATGKYFKLLDGDDWYDSGNLVDFIAALESVDADMVVTPYVEVGCRSGERVLKSLCDGRKSGVYAIGESSIRGRDHNMHYLCWSTEFARGVGLSLTEHCFYTDVEYACLPLPHAKTVFVWPEPVYLYRTEVSGQSMSISGRLRHWPEHERVFWRLVDEHNRLGPATSTAAGHLFQNRLAAMAQAHLRILCLRKPSPDSKRELRGFCRRLSQEAPEVTRAAKRMSKLARALYATHCAIYPFCNWYCTRKLARSRGGGD